MEIGEKVYGALGERKYNAIFQKSGGVNEQGNSNRNSRKPKNTNLHRFWRKYVTVWLFKL